MSDSLSSQFHAFTFRFGRRMMLRGFEVRAMMPDKREWAVIRERLDAAFDLVEQYAPSRFKMLQRDIRKVWVTGIPSRGAFVREEAMCVINFDFVTAESTRAEEVALTMIHEGTHARLARAGFGYDESIRPRVERLCLGSELVVARRFPHRDDLVHDVMQCLDWDDADWSAQAIRDRHIAALHDLGWAGRIGYHMGRALRVSLRPHANTR